MSQIDRAEGVPNVNLRQIGKPLVRTDAAGKAFGEAYYAGDLKMANMLYAKVLRADRASATIERLDPARARRLAGVHCVLTAADLPDRGIMTDMPGQTGGKTKDTTQPILARDRVRFFGEPLALVAAESEEIALAATKLIEVEYGDLIGVYDPFEALKPGAPVVYGKDNVIARYKIRKGDADKGFEKADLIVENTFRTHVQEQAFLEPEATLAWVDEHDVVNIRTSTQVVEHYRTVADAIGIPHNRVHLKAEYLGGGFGGKEVMTIEVYLALLALHTRKPVRLVLTREESFVAHGNRHPFTIRHRTGVANDGRIVAAEIQLTADGGAYAKLSPYVLLYATVGATGPYRVDDLRIDSVVAATNNLPTCAFRGFGTMQANLACEGQMEEIAKTLGMDPLEFRRRNYIATGDANVTGQIIESAVWSDRCATRSLEALGKRAPDKGPVRIGRGVACYQQSYGRICWMKDTSEAWVGVEVDGTVIVRSAVTEIGAGQQSALAQIAAEVLGVPMNEVVVYFGDTAVNPLAGTSTASRQLYMSGNATLMAATRVRENLLGCAAEHFGVEPGELDMADSRTFVVDDPDRWLPIEELVRKCAGAGIHRHHLAIFKARFSEGIDPETGQGRVFPDFTYGAQATDVAVDTETGEVTVLKSVGAHDVGQAVNLRNVEGQIEGSTLMGQGFALCEEVVYDRGRPLNTSLSDYLIPTAEDVPEIVAVVLESRSGLGPFGAKGIGEPAYAPVAASIVNAVADAIGVRIFDLPITPEKVVKAVLEKGDG